MIPLALVAGFLGSGKTTFLRQLSARNDGQRWAFLVNDFSAVNVDAQLLSELDGEVISIPGGSIFCRCLTTTFTNTLKKIARMNPPLDGVVIEASGMADPRSLADMLHETRLDEFYELSIVVSIVDPGTFQKLLKTLPAMRAQVECADVVLLNKTDVFDEDTIQQTEAAIRCVRDDVQVLRCVRGNTSIQFFRGNSHALKIHGEPTSCRDSSFLSATFRFRTPCNIGDVAELLNSYEHILWRVKGFVPTKAGLMELHLTMRSGCHGTLDIQPATTPAAQPVLAIIARGDAEKELDNLVNDLKQRYDFAPFADCPKAHYSSSKPNPLSLMPL